MECSQSGVFPEWSVPRVKCSQSGVYCWSVPRVGDSGTVVDKSFSNQKVASSIPCRSVLEQDTEPLIAPDVQCAISVNVQCVYILVSRFG